MKTVLFSLVYIIKPSVHMHVHVNTHASMHTHLHTTHLFCSPMTLSYRLNELRCLVVTYEPTQLLTKSSVTNFKSCKLQGMYIGQITAAACWLDLFNHAFVIVTGQPSIN